MAVGGSQGKHAIQSSVRTNALAGRVDKVRTGLEGLDDRLLADLLSACRSPGSLHDQLHSIDLLSSLLTVLLRRDFGSLEINTRLGDILMSSQDALFSLMHLLWDQFSSGRAALREVTSKALQLHGKVFPPLVHSSFVSDRLCSLLSDDGQLDKHVFAELEIIAKFSGTAAIVSVQPDFVRQRLPMLRDPTLSGTVGRLLAKTLTDRLRPQEQDKTITGSWLAMWQSIVTDVLLGGDEVFATQMLLYFLPDLFRHSKKAFDSFCIDLQRSCRPQNGRDIARLMQCIQIGKTAHLIESETGGLLEKLALVNIDQFRPFLDHEDDRLRVESFKCVLLEPRQTRYVSDLAFEVLLSTLPGLAQEADPEARKDILVSIRSFLFRFHASTQAAHTTSTRQRSESVARAEATSYLIRARAFAKRLSAMLRAAIEPGSSFQLTYISLYTMMLCSLFGWHPSARPLRCAGRLSSILPAAKLWQGMQLPFDAQLFDLETYRLLLDRLTDAFADNRDMAIALLGTYPATTGSDQQFEPNVDSLLLATRARDADGGARAKQFLIFSAASRSLTTQESDAEVCRQLERLRLSIDADARQAQSSLLHAAHARPLHGRIAALSYTLDSHPWQRESAPALTQLLLDTIASVRQVWLAVQDILCDDSPEGTNPVLPAAESGATRDEDTQIVLSFCWRALRQCADLVRTVIARSFATPAVPLLSTTELTDLGQLIQTWLVQVRHRGAFTAVEQVFVDLCRRLLSRSSGAEVQILPRQWLDGNIEGLSDSHRTRDITRRSAGLPMSIVSILVAEVSLSGTQHSLLDEAMDRLHTLAATPIIATVSEDDLPQVHAMNTLKDIFQEAALVKACEDHIERAFFLAMDGFYSESWALRNCALMLYNAVLQRSFGGYFSREHSDTHTMSTRTFFSRYPALYDRVESELESSVRLLLREDSPVVTTALHPLLTMIARLDLPKSGMDNDVYWSRRAKLARLVESCAASRIWLVRSMAAKALPTLVEPMDVASYCITALNQAATSQQNTLHGTLMQVDSLLTYSTNTTSEPQVDKILIEVAKAMLNRFNDMAGDNECCITHAVFLDIIAKHFLSCQADNKDVRRLQQMTIDHAIRWVSTSAVQDPTRTTPGREALAEVTATVVLKSLQMEHLRKAHTTARATVLARLIEHEDETIRLTVYDELAERAELRVLARSPTAIRALERISTGESWSRLVLSSRRALALLPVLDATANGSAATDFVQTSAKYLRSLEVGRGNQALFICTVQLLARTLGVCWCQSDDDTLDRFMGLVHQLADARQSVESRLAALGCIESCVVVMHKDEQRVDFARRLHFTLLVLLVDDDAEVRRRASLITCRHVLNTGPQTPYSARIGLFACLGASFVHGQGQASEVTIRGLLDMISGEGEKSLIAVLRSRLQPPSDLFEAEKPNQWRDELQDCDCALATLARLELPGSSRAALSNLAVDAKNVIQEAISDSNAATPLGRCANAEVWRLIRRCLSILSFAKQHGIQLKHEGVGSAATAAHPTLYRLLSELESVA